ncbi:WD-repeat family protein [Clostridiaceae bacterium JG1575]|nr:WD-repeat family protein [Clostridiaceae bacterium JG1575]
MSNYDPTDSYGDPKDPHPSRPGEKEALNDSQQLKDECPPQKTKAPKEKDPSEEGANLSSDNTTAQTISQAAQGREKESYKYEAFISYRHLEPDATVARKIHEMIETFPLPKEFQREGNAKPFRVFRDREELGAAGLGGALEEALRASRTLIVICSRRFKESPWCLREIDLFRRFHGDDHIIPILLEGEPKDAFPHQLLELKEKKIQEDGSITYEPKEVLAAEMRPAAVKDAAFPGYAALEVSDPRRVKELTAQSAALLAQEKYRIMAGLLGVSFGDLKQRDKERRQRRILTVSAFSAVLLLFFGLFMYLQWSRAVEQERLAKEGQARLTLQEAARVQNTGDRILTSLLAKEAMEKVTLDMKAYSELKTKQQALLNDLADGDEVALMTKINLASDNIILDTSPDSRLLVTKYQENHLAFLDIATGKRLGTAPAHDRAVMNLVFAPDGKTLISTSADNELALWDVQKRQAIRRKKLEQRPVMTRFTEDGASLAVVLSKNSTSFTLMVLNSADWTPKLTVPLASRGIRNAEFHAGRGLLMLEYADTSLLEIFSVQDGKKIASFPADPLLRVDPKDPQKTLKDPALSLEGRFSRDGEAVYLMNGQTLKKVRVKDQSLVFSLGGRRIAEKGKAAEYSSYFVKGAYLMESGDGKKLITRPAGRIETLDPQTGALLQTNSFSISTLSGDRSTDHMVVNQEGSRVLLSDSKGNVAWLEKGVLVSLDLDPESFKYGRLMLTKDDHWLTGFSNEGQFIAIYNLKNPSRKKRYPMNLIRTSPDGSLFLAYQDGAYVLAKTATRAVIRKIPPMAGLNVSESFFYRNLYLSADGALILAPNQQRTSASGKNESQNVFYDTKSGRVVASFNVDFKKVTPVFHPLKEEVLFLSSLGQAYVYSTKTFQELRRFPILEGFPEDLRFSKDGKKLLVNFPYEGSGQLLDYETGAVLYEGVGRVLALSSAEKEDLLYGIRANDLFCYSLTTQKERTTPLDEARNQMGVFQGNLYDINPDAGVLLTIVNSGSRSEGALFDLRSGLLLKRLLMDVSFNQGRGFLTPDGKGVIWDTIHRETTQGAGEGREIARKFVQLQYYSLERKEVAPQRVKDLLGDRELTDQERMRYGLERP